MRIPPDAQQVDGSPSCILHATTVAIEGHSIVITGKSGSGKSGLALELIARGAQLVADDRTLIRREGTTLMAQAPESISNMIEARGVGLLRVPTCGPVPVAAVVDLDQTETDRLPQLYRTHLLEIGLPLLRKSPVPHFPASLVLYVKYGRVD